MDSVTDTHRRNDLLFDKYRRSAYTRVGVIRSSFQSVPGGDVFAVVVDAVVSRSAYAKAHHM